jgi:hypothetical protein
MQCTIRSLIIQLSLYLAYVIFMYSIPSMYVHVLCFIMKTGRQKLSNNNYKIYPNIIYLEVK